MITHTRIKEDDLIRIRKLKVHENQADHEIIEQLLDFYEQYNVAMGNDVEQWK